MKFSPVTLLWSSGRHGTLTQHPVGNGGSIFQENTQKILAVNFVVFVELEKEAQNKNISRAKSLRRSLGQKKNSRFVMVCWHGLISIVNWTNLHLLR